MRELKKVTVLDGFIINVGALEPLPEGATVEVREMLYTEEYGWREVGWIPPMTQDEKIAQLEKENEELAQTLDMILTDLIPNLIGGN